MTQPVARSTPEGHDESWGFYAVERVVGKTRFLLAVLPAKSANWAIIAMGELYPELFPDQPTGELTARWVSLPGVANPMAEDGWVHYLGPQNVKCPRCQRSQMHPEPGHRISVRIRGSGSLRRTFTPGHFGDRCKRCHAELEFTLTAVGDPPPRHPALAKDR